jgi:sugar phosphate isomerase/epimerase
MSGLSRRQFLGHSAKGAITAGCLSAAAFELRADPLGLPIGFQSYSVRNLIGQDFQGTARQLAGVGYRTIEMCSPAGYVDSGFGGLVKYKPAELRGIINDAGLRCESSHFGPQELKKNLADRIGWSKGMGLKQMVLSSLGLSREAKMDDWMRGADWLNQLGEETQKAGIQFGYHNHDFEFQKIGGVLIYDELMKRLDPKLVRMQFQVAVISLGYEATTYLKKYPGRFISLHLADWSPSERKHVPVGKGVVDWPKLFAAAKTGGVKNYFVEVENLDGIKDSYPYLHHLKA